MISLARHIELLLLEHDCVIVPGLGGFIANHAEAKYSGGKECLFFPPYRTIGFNQQLQMNDGLLVQSYMMAYDASYPAAYLQMEKEIEAIMNELEMKGTYRLENIGELRKGIHQNITFTAPEAGLLTPSLFGLYSYEMPSLASAIKAKEMESTLQSVSSISIPKRDEQHRKTDEKGGKTKKHRDIVIRLNRHWLDVGISAAAAVLLFFCFSYPAMKNISTETDTVVAAFYPPHGVQSHSSTEAVAPRRSEAREPQAAPAVETASEPEHITEKPALAETAKDEGSTQPMKATPQSAEAKFAIVMASYVSQRNAETFIAHLSEVGFTEGRYVKKGKTSRILYAGYATETEAYTALHSLRQQNAMFDDAWVLEL